MYNKSKTASGYTTSTFPWSMYLSDRDGMLKLFKSSSLFLQTLSAIGKIDISSLVNEDGSINAGDYMNLIISSRSPDISSKAILVFLDMIANCSRSSYFSGKAGDYVDTSVGVPLIPSLYGYNYSAWKELDNVALRPMLLGNALASIDYTIFDAACGELQYVANAVDKGDLKRKLHNAKFPQNTHRVSLEILAAFELDTDKFSCPNFNALKPIGRAMICSEWVFASNSNKLVRDINDLDRKTPLIEWPECSDSVKANSSSILQKLLAAANSESPW